MEAMLFFHKDDWDSLYKLVEIIAEDLGGEHKLKKKPWLSSKELSRFKQTVQSAEAIGDAARHARIAKFRPPEKPMSLRTARSWVRRWFMAWVAEKR